MALSCYSTILRFGCTRGKGGTCNTYLASAAAAAAARVHAQSVEKTAAAAAAAVAAAARCGCPAASSDFAYFADFACTYPGYFAHTRGLGRPGPDYDTHAPLLGSQCHYQACAAQTGVHAAGTRRYLTYPGCHVEACHCHCHCHCRTVHHLNVYMRQHTDGASARR